MSNRICTYDACSPGAIKSSRPAAPAGTATANAYIDLLVRETQLSIYDIEKEYLYTTILVRNHTVYSSFLICNHGKLN